MAAFFREQGHTLRFIEYMDVGHTNGWRLDDVVPAAEIVATLDAAFGSSRSTPPTAARSRSAGATSTARGEFGVIASVTQPFCGDCTRARLSAEGKLFTCLFAVRGHDLRALIRGGASDDELASGSARPVGKPQRPLFGASLRGDGRPAEGRDELHRRVDAPAPRPLRRLESDGHDHHGRSWAALFAAWLGGSRPPACDLVRLRRRSISSPAELADRNPPRRSRTATTSFDLETSVAHRLYELTFQHFVDQRHLLETAVSWTYWNSEFTVVGLAVLWVYLRRHDAVLRLPQLDPARQRDRPLRLLLLADRAAAPARPRLRQPAPRRPRLRWPRTRTPRCRACTPPTR